jgi:hypothetical protein
MKRFLLIVDSYADENLPLALRTLGFEQGRDFEIASFGSGVKFIEALAKRFTEGIPASAEEGVSEGSLSAIFEGTLGERAIDAEQLLVFTGTFHGQIGPMVALVKQIKSANSRAKVYLRSTIGGISEPVFDGRVEKNSHDHTQLLATIREVFGMN